MAKNIVSTDVEIEDDAAFGEFFRNLIESAYFVPEDKADEILQNVLRELNKK